MASLTRSIYQINYPHRANKLKLNDYTFITMLSFNKVTNELNKIDIRRIVIQ